MADVCGGNRTLWGFNIVFIPLLGPSWVTGVDDVMLGGEKGRREAWFYHRHPPNYDALT